MSGGAARRETARPVRLSPLGHADIPGGGQVVVEGDLAFVGHIEPPHGTSILDVSDPRAPRLLARLEVPPHTHSHKVRARDGVMLVNHEGHPFGARPAGFQGGLRIYDVTRPAAPRAIAVYRTAGTGAHRFDFDGRYVYLSAEVDGYVGNITLVLDLADPAHPREVSRWWLPGQWTAGGESPAWTGRAHRTHHPLRFDDRLYVSCWEAGLAVVDIAAIEAPKTLLRMDSPEGYPTHTVLPLPRPAAPGAFLLAVDEGWNDEGDALPAGLWVADVTGPAAPTLVARYKRPPPRAASGFWGAHQPHERIIDGLAFVAWFQNGLRVVDVSDPRTPLEVGAFVPPERAGRAPLSNDVFVDARRRVYLADRNAGLDILEWSR